MKVLIKKQRGFPNGSVVKKISLPVQATGSISDPGGSHMLWSS